MNKFVTKRKWIGAVLLVFLGGIFFIYQFGDNIADALFRTHMEKYVGEIECLESKSDLSSKGTYFRVKGYPRSLYSYTDSNAFSYQGKVNEVKINMLYYEEIEEVLESYFKDQEVVFHFNSAISYLDLSRRNQGVIDVDKSLIEQMCASDSKEASFYIRVTAALPSNSPVGLDEASRDLYLFLRDQYESMNANIKVHLVKTKDIYFFEDQEIYEYYSYADKRLNAQDACVDAKMNVMFSYDDYNGCDTVTMNQTDEIIKHLVNKYEEFYSYRFKATDYSCSEENNKAICSYTIERVKNGLTYDGTLEFEGCWSIREHIRDNKEEFKEQMKMN